MKQIIIKLLPIIIVFLLVVYSREFVEFSHTILGKLIAVSIIVFYIKCDILYGLLACLMTIFYRVRMESTRTFISSASSFVSFPRSTLTTTIPPFSLE